MNPYIVFMVLGFLIGLFAQKEKNKAGAAWFLITFISSLLFYWFLLIFIVPTVDMPDADQGAILTSAIIVGFIYFVIVASLPKKEVNIKIEKEDKIDKLYKLRELRDTGDISENEFSSRKEALGFSSDSSARKEK